MNLKGVAQLLVYQALMSGGDRVGLGVLIDQTQLRLSFSMFQEEDLPLPVTLISPPIQWRTGPLLSPGACVALSILLKENPSST